MGDTLPSHLNLLETRGYQQYVFFPESKDYTGHLNNLYFVQQGNLRGIVAAGQARISDILACTRGTMKEVEDYAKYVCGNESRSFSNYPEDMVVNSQKNGDEMIEILKTPNDR